MEKILVKTAIYSFISSFSLLLVFLNRTKFTEDVNGMGSPEVTSYQDFFFAILEYSIIISIIAIILVFVYLQFNKK
ncbi:hypothetical protein [Peribacillus frigoritolerans]|uniref:hypothetical protein n=1 Tax=Peribacillus frigoritolerans TaxID=450367 RepID=UPI0010597095|nr:hypothetical protein [Peribacillus frigoritolerans]TDL76157.1 hypothetical protein E2R53_20915 [Peribacillus frigoritolerans]